MKAQQKPVIHLLFQYVFRENPLWDEFPLASLNMFYIRLLKLTPGGNVPS